MTVKIGSLATNGFLSGEWAGEPTECADHKCVRAVNTGDACFIEMQSSSVYCDDCGKVKRYIAKKAAQRAVLDCN